MVYINAVVSALPTASAAAPVAREGSPEPEAAGSAVTSTEHEMTTLFIAPSGLYGPSGQCRIYAASKDPAPRARYEDKPEAWREVGLMDSSGNVRCIEPEFDALRDDAPLMAGTYWEI